MRMYARMYARAYDCQDSTGHTTSTPTDKEYRRKREEHRQSIQTKFAIVGRSTRKNEKKVKKKFVNKEKGRIFVTEIKQQTSITTKSKQYENTNIQNLQKRN